MSFEETNKSYKGQAIGGLTLGIIGTALALNAGGLGNCLGTGWLGNNGIFGGRGNCYGNGAGWNWMGSGSPRAEIEQSTISALGSEIALLKSARYTDYVGQDLYKNIVAFSNREDEKLANLQNQVTAYVIDLDKRVALNEQAQRLNREYDNLARDAGFKLLEQKIDCCCDKANARIDCLTDKTAMADASILSYVNSNFVSGVLKLPITSICPEPAPATTTA